MAIKENSTGQYSLFEIGGELKPYFNRGVSQPLWNERGRADNERHDEGSQGIWLYQGRRRGHGYHRPGCPFTARYSADYQRVTGPIAECTPPRIWNIAWEPRSNRSLSSPRKWPIPSQQERSETAIGPPSRDRTQNRASQDAWAGKKPDENRSRGFNLRLPVCAVLQLEPLDEGFSRKPDEFDASLKEHTTTETRKSLTPTIERSCL